MPGTADKTPAPNGSAASIATNRTLAPAPVASHNRRDLSELRDRADRSPVGHALAAMQRRADNSNPVRKTAALVVQRHGIETNVTGLTHLVIMKGGTIYGGEEGDEISSRVTIKIDTGACILSRRGPNQEIHGESDRHGAHQYTWVRVMQIGDNPAPADCYIRGDAITHALPQAPQSVVSDRRERHPAEPVDAPVERPATPWFDIQTIESQFVDAKEACIRRAKQAGATDDDIGGVGKPKQGQLIKILTAGTQLDVGKRTVETRKIGKAPAQFRLLEGFEAAARAEMQQLAQTPKDWTSKDCVARCMILLGSNLTVPVEIAQKLDDRSIYSDWYQDVGSLMTLLAERPDLPRGAVVKLLKFFIMRNQLQAPIDDGTMQATGRQTSPLTSEDYARGMRTRLWSVASNIQMLELSDMCLAYMGEKLPDKRKFLKDFNKAFYVVAAAKPFDFDGKKPVLLNTVDRAPMQLPLCYFSALRLQVLPIPSNEKSSYKGKVSKYMGARGLRASLGESADIIAETLAGLIKKGALNKALALLEPEFRQNTTTEKGLKAKTPLSSIQYDTRGLVMLREHDPETHRLRDPIVSSTDAQIYGTQGANGRIGGLKNAYDDCTRQSVQKGIPALMSSNLAVFSKLAGGDILGLFGPQTPAQVTATLTDTLLDLADIMRKHLASLPDRDAVPLRKTLLETFYEKMQILHEAVRFQLSWNGGDPALLHEGIGSMLPEDSAKPTSTHAAPHGLAMIDQIHNALGKDTKTGVLKSSYFETPELFEGHTSVPDVTTKSLQSLDLIVLEPHPNNAEERDVKAHDPVALLKYLQQNPKKRTVLMDVTLNHLGEDEIKAILTTAAPMIQSGTLNLVLMQSGTKFLQHGMDIVSLGIAAVFNDSKNWVTFNTTMTEKDQSVPDDDALYLGRLLTTAKDELGGYLNRIRDNTTYLRKKLERVLSGETHALEVTKSDDERTVYVAIAPKRACIDKVYKTKVEELNQAPKGKKHDLDTFAMQDVYHRILARMAELSLVTRSSFGFNLTNMGQCITTIRITPGIEEQEFYDAYVTGIMVVDAELMDEGAEL